MANDPMVGRTIAALLAVAALVVPAAAPRHATAQEAGPRITARMEWEPGYLGRHRPSTMTFGKDAPEGLVVPPAVKSPVFGQLTLGPRAVLHVVVDTAEDHPRIWVDRDFDSDLLDEGAGEWKTSGAYEKLRATLLVPYEEDEPPVAVEMDFTHKLAAARDVVSACLHVHKTGTVVLAGRLRAVAMTDGGTDMGYDDPAVDWIYLDVDGDGRINTATGSRERLLIGKPFRVAGEGWVATPTGKAAHAIEFTRTDDAPPDARRTWVAATPPAAGRVQTPPSESDETLLLAFEDERTLKYAERTGTITKLGRVGTHAAAWRLHETAQDDDEDANVRAACARALGNPAYLEKHAAQVIALTQSAPPSVAAGALQALHGMGHPGREAVYRKALEDSNATVVGAAARYLAYLGTASARKTVLSAARGAAQAAVRYQAYLGLRSTADGPPEKLMLAGARDSSYASLQAQALRDLHSIDHPRTRDLALDAADESKVVATVAYALIDVLGAFGDEKSVAAMLTLATNGTAAVRPRLVKSLASLRSTGARDALAQGLRSKEPQVRLVAAQVLAGWPDKVATDALMKQVKREKDADAAAAMLESLGDHQDPAAVALMLKAAKSRNAILRGAGIRALARVGVGLPKVRAFFEKLLKATSWEDRIVAIDAAAAAGDVSLGPAVLASVAHERWEVRLAVAEALRKLRFKKAVGPLVEQIAQEEERRVRVALGITLFQLTGMNLYDEAKLWQRWWSDHGASFEMPVDIPQAPTNDGGTRGGFFGIPIESDRVVFLIDQSGSMQVEDHVRERGAELRTRLDSAVAEVLRAIGQMRDGSRVNVLLFHSTARPWKDKLQKLGPKMRKALTTYLERQEPTGGTNIYDPLEAALLDGQVDTIMLLSDGAPGAGKYVGTDDILRGVRRHNQTRRIAIHCVSLGRDSALLRRLAEENGGKYVRR